MNLLANVPAQHPLLWAAAPAPPADRDDAVGVSVEIAPRDAVCTVACPTEQPAPAQPAPSLPVTGGEPLSLALPFALLVAGIVALAWSRRPRRSDRAGADTPAA